MYLKLLSESTKLRKAKLQNAKLQKIKVRYSA